MKVKRGGNCGGSLIAVGYGRVAGSDVSLGRGFFSSLIILYRGRRFVIDEFDRWIRLGTILFFRGKGGCFVFDTRDEVVRFDDWFVIRIGRQKWRSSRVI